MASVEIIIVHLNQTPIGTLAQKDNKEFLKSGIQISPYKLPLKVGIFRCDDDTFEELWGVLPTFCLMGGRLLIDSVGVWRLSPFYDLTFSYGVELNTVRCI